MESEPTGRHPALPRKKPYLKPCVQVYGALELITRNAKATSVAGDNPTKRNHKTGG
jgi:hypothetical protein